MVGPAAGAPSQVGSPQSAGRHPRPRTGRRRAGFGIARIRYYTPLIGAFVENILMRMAERALARWGSAPRAEAPRRRRPRRGGSTPGGAEEEALRAARTSAKQRLAAKGPLYFALKGVTALMTLDVSIFGRVRTGPFFVLLERRRPRVRVGRPTDDPAAALQSAPRSRWPPCVASTWRDDPWRGHRCWPHPACLSSRRAC